MHRRRDPSLSTEATAGYTLSAHVVMQASGLGETDDLLTDAGLPQPSSVMRPGEAGHSAWWTEWIESGCSWLVINFRVDKVGSRVRPREMLAGCMAVLKD